MSNRKVSIALLILLCGVIFSSSVSANDDSYEPGFVEWTINPVEQLFVEGLSPEDAVLQRARPDNSPGGISIDTGFSGQILSLNSEPIETSFSQSVKMSVFFSVYLDQNSGPQTCTRQQSGTALIPGSDATTTLVYSVDVGGVPVYDAVVTNVVDKISSNEAMNFSGEINDVNITANEGDVITLTVSATHNCVARARVQWGALEQNGGGIVIVGNLYQPQANILIDQSKIAHIEFRPLLPWGGSDISEIKWELWGPMKPYEKISLSSDKMMEDSTTKSLLVRELSDNKSVWTWSGKEILEVGDANLEFCIRTVYGDPNEDCQAFGIIRFEVLGEDPGILSAKLVLTATTVLALLAFLANAFNQGLLVPLPILVALAAMMILFIPTAFVQTNLGSQEAIGDYTRINDAELYDESGNTVRISEIFDGQNAMVIGVGLPASENMIDQAKQFNETIEHFGNDIAVVHIISGLEPKSSDITQMKENLNITWPIFIDKDGTFSAGLPNGVSDSVVVIDEGMHVTYNNAPVGYSKEIIDAVEEIPNGGSQNFASHLSLLIGPGLFLFFIALPREGWVKPEEPLPPGILWASIIASGAAGIMLVNLPMLIATLLPIGVKPLFYLDIILMIWFTEMAFFTAKNGKPWEVAWLSKIIHGLFSENFQNWRPIEDLERDVLLGVWFGWFGILSFPYLFPQVVASTMLSGLFGILSGLFYLIMCLSMGGFTVLILRWVAAIGGPISRMFGRYGAESFTQFVGWCLLPLAIWVSANAILTNMNSGIL